jgi:hypothetical protein
MSWLRLKMSCRSSLSFTGQTVLPYRGAVTDPPDRGRLRRFWLGALAAYFLLGSAWALALPVNATYDEKQHIVRAYGVADGQLVSTSTVREEGTAQTPAFRVPSTLLPGEVHCVWYPEPVAASCQTPSTDPVPRLRASGAARYNPVYYLPVGLPMRISPDERGVLAGRLVSVLLASLLLASAVAAAVRVGRRAIILGIALVTTPLAIALSAAINPNGLEVAAGILLFATLLARLRGGDTQRRLLWLAGLAIALLCILRPIGPLIAGLAVLACLLLARPRGVRELLASRDARWILGGSAAAGLVAFAGWTVVSRSAEVVSDLNERSEQLTAGEFVREMVTYRLPFYLYQPIAEVGYGETHVNPLVTVAWYALIAVFVGTAWRAAGRRLVLVSAGLLAVLAMLLVTLDAFFVRSIGWVSQGRYVLPVAAGVVIAAGFWLPPRRPLWWAIVGGALLPLHGYTFLAVMVRYRAGEGAALNPFAGTWTPSVGPVLPLLLCLAGAGLVAWLAAASGSEAAPDNPAAQRVTIPRPRPDADDAEFTAPTRTTGRAL